MQNLTQGQLISAYRIILEVPPYLCESNRYSYNEKGFKIKIGKTSIIKIPLSMLENCIRESVKNKMIYNRSVFERLYPLQCKDHGCHIHSIGQMFVAAGLADFVSKHDYKLR